MMIKWQAQTGTKMLLKHMRAEQSRDGQTERDCLDAVLVNPPPFRQENQTPALWVPLAPNSLASLPLSAERLPPCDLTGHMPHANELLRREPLTTGAN